MMPSKKEEPIIEVKHLSKQYVIGIDSTYKTLSESVTSALRHPIKTLKDFRRQNETFWALKDVSFEVERGEVLGIIGKNGAGKSTLLKILSRITYPTEGEVKMRGRVGSLLEVGTGFHPELSGRENIYFNGAILGMRKREIDEKFDEIVKFAGVEKFLDTPVKRYSSGMNVRLGFSIAAHLEPEILIVDEVLAVGDAEFQKKCLGKMSEVAQGGRTVLFVSHNMNAVDHLCSKCILLEKGSITRYTNDVQSAIQNYLFGTEINERGSVWINPGNEFRNSWFIPYNFYLADKNGSIIKTSIRNDQDCWIIIEGEIREIDPSLTIGCAMYSEDGTLLFWSYQTDQKELQWPELKIGYNTLKCKFPQRLLNEGVYRIEFIGGLHYKQWLFEPSVNSPSITITISGGLSDSPLWIAKRNGLLAPVLNWEVCNQNIFS